MGCFGRKKTKTAAADDEVRPYGEVQFSTSSNAELKECDLSFGR